MRTLLLVIGLVAVGVIGYFWWHEHRYQAKTEQPILEVVKRGKIQDKITGSGKVEPRGGLRLVNVETDGKIISGAKNVTLGKVVQDGEVLLKLDDIFQQDSIRAAEAAITAADGMLNAAEAGRLAAVAKVNSVKKELEVAQTQVRNAERKREKDVGSQEELNEAKKRLEAKEAEAEGASAYVGKADADIKVAKSNIQLAQAKLILAKRGLDQTLIKAPSSGEIVYIESQLVQDGQVVPKGAILLKIVPNPNQWEVKAQISEQDIGRLRTKLAQGPVSASFSTEAYSGEAIKRYTGKVTSIAPLPTSAQRSPLSGLDMLQLSAMGGGASGATGPSNYTVTIEVDPLDEATRKTHPLYQGFTATDIQLVLNEFSNVVAIPSLALSFKPEGLSDSQQNEINRLGDQGWSTVWLWSNGQYEPRYIKAGASEEGRTHVKEVMNGKPEELVDKPVVVEGPKRPEKNGGLFSGNQPIKIPG